MTTQARNKWNETKIILKLYKALLQFYCSLIILVSFVSFKVVWYRGKAYNHNLYKPSKTSATDGIIPLKIIVVLDCFMLYGMYLQNKWNRIFSLTKHSDGL